MIEEIKKRINIVELAFELGLEPTKQGFIYSIYKDERNRSLKLYPETNSFFCFATGHGGDVIDFYRDYHRLNVKDAIKELAVMAGIENVKGKMSNVRRERINDYETKDNIEKLSVLEIESDYYEERAAIIEYDGEINKNVAENNAYNELIEKREKIQRRVFNELMKYCNGVSDEAYKYLTGPKRGLTEATIKHFGLFSADKIKKCREFLINKFDESELIISGLFNNSGWYVFEHHEIIIPYYENNEIIYLRGRALPKDCEADTKNKYISLFNFSTNLGLKRFYNIDVLLKLQKNSELIVCEGEFDTMMAVQNGYEAIGIPGVTNIPRNELYLLDDFEIYVLFDNDEAGGKAVMELGKLINKKINVIEILNHKDLTELVNARGS